MKLRFKNNFIGYFRFYYRITGTKLLIYLFLSILVSFLDGIGLSMFMPLLQSVGEGAGEGKRKTMGQLHYFTDAIERLGMPLTLNNILFVFLLIFSVKGVFKFIQLNYQATLRQFFMKKVRHILIDQLQGLTYRGFLKVDAGRIQNTLITEATRLLQTMTFYFNAAQYAVMLITYIVLAFFANYKFAFLVAAGAGLSNLIFKRIFIATKKASVQVSEKGSDFNSFLGQAIHYFKYLKSTGYFRVFSGKIKKVIDDTELLNKKMGFYSAVSMSLREPIIMGIVVLVIFIQLNWIGGGMGSILVSLLLFYRALGFLTNIQSQWQSFIQNVGAMHSIAAISDDMSEMQERTKATAFPGIRKELVLQGLQFSYHPASKVLDSIDLTIPKNQTVAFIGESGSGKTTLANIISGLIQPDTGTVLIDNVSLSEYNIDSYRNRIGYISQDPVIFTDDIFNNITFWAERSPENMNRFHKTIELASLREFVNGQPEKEKALLGDHGIMISGGQKQRISIARELFKEVDILILDEATSALDSETEKVIQENIENLHGSYTMVIIAHRLSTIKDADRIYLLDKGKVSASGTFEEMLEYSPRFKRMVALQEF